MKPGATYIQIYWVLLKCMRFTVTIEKTTKLKSDYKDYKVIQYLNVGQTKLFIDF